MRRPVLLLVALAFSVPLAAQTPVSRTITVSGDAEVRVVPDEVVLRFGVETRNANLDAATAANERHVAAVVAAARQHGVPLDLIQTDYLSLEPQYTTRRSSDLPIPELYGYLVRRTVSVTLRDLDAFDALFRDAVAAGANQVHGIEFRTTDLRTHRDEARLLAVRAAREKAEALAGELGEAVGRPRSIAEGSAGWVSGYGLGWRGGLGAVQNVIVSGPGGSAPVDGVTAPGQIAVRAQVSVVFDLAE